MGCNLHLILEAHVVLDILPGHADVVGDLVDLVALLGARQDAAAAQAVDGGMVSVVGLDERRGADLLDVAAGGLRPADGVEVGMTSLAGAKPGGGVTCRH